MQNNGIERILGALHFKVFTCDMNISLTFRNAVNCTLHIHNPYTCDSDDDFEVSAVCE